MTGSQQLILGEGAGGAVAATYIEDVFSTWLYTGTNAAQTITNGIDLSTKGGLVWTKSRDDTLYHVLSDSSTGPNNVLRTNSTAAAFTYTSNGWSVPVFNTTGYTTSDSGYVTQNAGGLNKFVSWTFRKQPKFFDVVTYTGDGTTTQLVNHSLGSQPGFILIKSTSNTSDWFVLARSDATNYRYLFLNSTNASGGTYAQTSCASSTQLNLGYISANIDSFYNISGRTYVAYLFAHDAGGFGLTGTDNVISCGSYTGTGAAGNAITLGYEPQWVLIKRTDSTGNWGMTDTMRGMSVTNNAVLYSNLSNAELDAGSPIVYPTATGFTCGTGSAGWNASGGTYIYIAIRRGPMKTPTTGTSVFAPIAKTGNGSTTTVTNVGFPTDLFMFKWRSFDYGWKQQDRLRGFVQQLASDQIGAEANSGTYTFGTVNNTGYTYGSDASINTDELNFSGVTSAVYSFRRAPGFFDVVCYTGTGGSQTVSHNLGVAPELIIVKGRDQTASWWTYSATLGYTQSVRVNLSDAAVSGETRFGSSNPTASSFYVNATTSGGTNSSGFNYVAYLFATVSGVSKVGSYTGTGALQTINCGFTGGARFVLIKRTDSTGDWFTYDSARGITSGNDPYLLMNSTAAEVTGTNYVDTTSVGFQVTAAAPAGLNANGGTYIFLAIA